MRRAPQLRTRVSHPGDARQKVSITTRPGGDVPYELSYLQDRYTSVGVANNKRGCVVKGIALFSSARKTLTVWLGFVGRMSRAAALVGCVGAVTVNAATINVNSLADDVFPDATGALFDISGNPIAPPVSPKCTLRMALAAANLDQAIGGGLPNGCAAGSGVDTIEIQLAGTIEVADRSMSAAPAADPATVTYLLIASRGVNINGPASGTVAISGASVPFNSTKRLMVMSDGDGTTDVPMSISRVTFEKGRVVGNSAGCLFSRESLTLTDVKFDRCESVGTSASTSGGFAGALGVFVDASVVGPVYVRPNVTLLRVTATGNRAIRGSKTSRAEAGFAAFGTNATNQAGVISITESSFSLNSAERYGALLVNNATSVTITDSGFYSNTATGSVAEAAGRFGGFALLNVTGNVSISGGGVVGNFAEQERAGFGIQTIGGSVTLADMLIAGNIAQTSRIGGFEVLTDTFDVNGNCTGAQRRPVTLTNLIVRGNLAQTQGGGFRIGCNGAVVASGLLIESNQVDGSDQAGVSSGQGAAFVFDNNSFSLTNSTIAGNRTYANRIDPANFGGFQNFLLLRNGAVNLSGVVVRSNWVARNEGGISISAGAAGRTAVVENSSFYDNRAQALTTLFMSGEGTFSVRNSTFAGNSSTTSAGGGTVGINANSTAGPLSLTLENVTIARNGPLDNAFGNGGFGSGTPQLSLTIKNSIMGGYQFGNGSSAFLNVGAGYTYSIQNSLFETSNGLPVGTCGVNGVLCNLDAKLESLTNNGPLAPSGDTQMTLALRPGSPALDSGAATTLTTDQRGAGFPRVVGAAVDMGAYESPALTAPLPCKLDMDGDNQVSATKEGLVLLRAMLGFSEANAVANSGITQPQWNAARVNLNANCGTNFTP